MKIVDHPAELAQLFEADRETHIYGLGDLEEPYWKHSTWYRDGPAAVGLVSVGGEWVTGYAMSRVASRETLALLAEVHDKLPENSWVTGSTGMFQHMGEFRRSRSMGDHWRMVLDRLEPIDHPATAVTLTRDDLADMTLLQDSDPGRAFWKEGMLNSYPFVGIWEEGQLVAQAGCHVASARYGVAAIGGILVHPSHRGRGLGAAVTYELCRRLLGRYRTIGLNVETANEPALRIYDRLGFRRAFQYEEIELL